MPRVATSGRVPTDYASLPGLIADFDPSNLASITFGTGSNVASFASAVGGWVVTQAVDADRPVWSATAINGRPGITYDGTSDSLSGAAGLASAIDASAPFSVFAVTQRAVANDFHGVWSLGSLITSDYHVSWFNSTNLDRTQRADSGGTTFNNGSITTTTEPRVLGTLYSGSAFTQYVDAGISINNSANTRVPVCDLFTIGARVQAGTPSLFFRGPIGRLLVYNSMLSSATALIVIAYLRSYYGI